MTIITDELSRTITDCLAEFHSEKNSAESQWFVSGALAVTVYLSIAEESEMGDFANWLDIPFAFCKFANPGVVE